MTLLTVIDNYAKSKELIKVVIHEVIDATNEASLVYYVSLTAKFSFIVTILSDVIQCVGKNFRHIELIFDMTLLYQYGQHANYSKYVENAVVTLRKQHDSILHDDFDSYVYTVDAELLGNIGFLDTDTKTLHIFQPSGIAVLQSIGKTMNDIEL